MIVPKDLISLSECAEKVGVAYGTITSWKTRHADFPKCYPRLPGQHHLIVNVRESEFDAWYKAYRKRSRPQAGSNRLDHRRRAFEAYRRTTKRPKRQNVRGTRATKKRSLSSRIKRFLKANTTEGW